MFNIFATAKSGMNAYQEKLDYLSNDLVNISTTGYKSTDVNFKDLLLSYYKEPIVFHENTL